MKPFFDQHGITLYHGDNREVMASLPVESVERCVTDPPYGLEFMGKGWDHGVPGVEFWQAILRILKPGAHLLSFGGTRTSHRLVCAIEDAGFVIRDSVVWHYGSGFPKSLNIGKAIDKAAGAEREVICKNPNGRNVELLRFNGDNARPNLANNPPDITAPATEAAKQWDGWGTALKPSHEPICVAMKPLDGTFAANAQKHGVAGLAIDKGRIGTNETDAKREHNGKVYEGVADGYKRPNKSSYTHKTDWQMQPAGRWPANTILSHHPDCQQVGTKRVKGHSGYPNGPGGKSHHYSSDKRSNEVRPDAWQHPSADADGLEIVEAWECVEGCPVRMLDDQSGVLTSGGGRKTVTRGCLKMDGNERPSHGNNDYQSDFVEKSTVGASRFFYTAKASKRERGEGNTHPTVKPIAIMEYLLKLTSTPTGGVVIDPFAGSGTTGLAAYNLGFPCILIEQSEEYCDIIVRRLEAAMQQQPLFPAEAITERQEELFV